MSFGHKISICLATLALFFAPLKGIDLSAPSLMIANDAGGHSYAVWLHSENLNTFVQASTLPSGSSVWGSPQTIGGGNGLIGLNATVAAGPHESAIAAWTVFDSHLSAAYPQVALFREGAWSSPQSFETHVGFSPSSLSMNEQGDAFLVLENLSNQTTVEMSYLQGAWGEKVALNEIDSEAPDVPPKPPKNFKGILIKNRFPLIEECIDRLSWQASPDPTVVGYRLFHDKKPLAIFPKAPRFSIDIRRVNCGEAVKYRLVSFNSKGTTSKPISVMVHNK